MATYDLTTSSSYGCATGDILNCPYSGDKITITLYQGEYKLECWGAQGATAKYSNNTTSYVGANGGYSTGILTLSSATTLYLYAGGAGTLPTTTVTFAGGGFNGGGNGLSVNTTYMVGGGGGASDIRIGYDSLYARVIVAGGGGAAGDLSAGYYNYQAGAGGGTTGASGVDGYWYYDDDNWGYVYAGRGGSQTSGGTSYYYGTYYADSSNVMVNGNFGTGGTLHSSRNSPAVSGGGGGWYGGGGCVGAGAGGGSGYVFTSSTISSYPSGCLLTNDYFLATASTALGTTSFTSPTGTAETGHSGNGYIRITVIQGLTPITIPTISTASVAYTGSSITPTISNYDSTKMTQSGTTSAIMPGTYFVSFIPKEGYMWSDGTLDTKYLAWTITSTYKRITPYIYNGTSFEKYTPWIYNSSL